MTDNTVILTVVSCSTGSL